ncbi:MAG TPA: ROK family protein [Candidatus Merdicola faecigallinarum]|uniref:ROK family protein n=1 Tax=Candidatus Merdicola faecigallinarum TaxID=2840862 RepID=A0A9D1M231_9FIRM|nr:ROK family protein [Candidatus Merdicola faecigallinarum]
MKRIRQLKNLCGIDVGCTNIKMVAVIGESSFEKSIPSGDNFSKGELIKAISEFYMSFDYNFEGLGIAFSGCTSDGMQVCNTSLQCLDNLSVYDFAHLNCKNIQLINDSNATALAGLLEYPNAKVLLGITNGTGIGCGIVINGQLFTGANGFAGQIYGNPTVDPNGKIIKNGKICSGSKVLKKLSQNSNQDQKQEIIHQAATYLGIEIVSLIHSFNPDIVYLAGGGFNYPNYLDTLIRFIYQHTYSDFLTNLQIVQTDFSSYSGCFGAMKHLLMK